MTTDETQLPPDDENSADHTPAAGEVSDTPPMEPARRLLLIGGMVLGVVGAAIAIYTILHHLELKAAGATDAFCNINQKINCDAVASSKWAEIFGIPMGVWGLGYFLASMVVLGVALSRHKTAVAHFHAYVALVAAGVASSLVLGYIAWFQIGAVCIACLGTYLVTFAQAGLVGIYRREIPPAPSVMGLVNGGMTATLVVAVCAIGFAVIKPSVTVRPNHSQTTTNPNGDPLPTLDVKAQTIPIDRSAYSGLGEDFRKGRDEADITIVEFADFQCPPCRRLAETMREIRKEYGDAVQIVFKNFPIDEECNRGTMHPFACEAARLARCAGEAGKFWEFHDKVFDRQPDISLENLRKWAAEVGVPAAKIDSCLASTDILAKIKDDVALGERVGVNATPSVFINGRRLLAPPFFEVLKREIDRIRGQN